MTTTIEIHQNDLRALRVVVTDAGAPVDLSDAAPPEAWAVPAKADSPVVDATVEWLNRSGGEFLVRFAEGALNGAPEWTLQARVVRGGESRIVLEALISVSPAPK